MLAFDFPNEGITLKIDITQGQLLVYGSFSILNPNSLTADFSFQSTSDGISYFISPELYQSSTIRFNVSRSADLYISLIGLQNNNIFLLNSTFGDTSDASQYSLHVSYCYIYFRMHYDQLSLVIGDANFVNSSSSENLSIFNPV